MLFVDDAVAQAHGQQWLLAGNLEHADDHYLGAGNCGGDRSDLAGGTRDGALARAGGVQVEEGLAGLRALAHPEDFRGLAGEPVLEPVDDRLRIIGQQPGE